MSGDSQRVQSDPAILETVQLLEAILPHLTSGTLARQLELRTDGGTEILSGTSLLQQAVALYKVQTQTPVQSSNKNADATPFAVAFEALVRISLACVKDPAPGQVLFTNARECLSGVLSMLMGLVGRLDERHQVERELVWAPVRWLVAMEAALHEVSTLSAPHLKCSYILPV